MRPTDTLRVATWNCFGVPTSLEGFLTGRPFWPERLDAPEVCEALARYDVVCIQENLISGVYESLQRVQRAGRFEHFWCDPMGPDGPTATFVGGGLVYLSRLPLRVRFARLARGAGPDGYARKGLAVADVTLPSGRTAHVLNTHLQADDDNVPGVESRATRAAQLAGIARAVAELEGGGAPVVLCGDFNVPQGTGEYEEMRATLGAGLVDYATRAGLTSYDADANDVAACFHGGGPRRALFDYVLGSAERVRATDVTTLLDVPLTGVPSRPAAYAARVFSSDHYAVGATLEIG
jgi:endonuclease/exonuclease/phosphatase family metal-dependent hydrolase